MRNRLIFLGSGILLLLISIILWSSTSMQNLRREAEMGTQKCGREVGLIPFKRLSYETVFPFLYAAHPLSDFPKHPYYEEYRAAVTRFPEVRACLLDSEKEKQTPNLTRFDWNKMNSTFDAEVCLFRVFSSIGSIEESRQWFESQGFKPHPLYQASGDPGLLIMEAGWFTDKCGERFVSRHFWEWLSQLLDNNPISTSVWFTGDGEVRAVGVSYIYE
jgi:hypothetical protein